MRSLVSRRNGSVCQVSGAELLLLVTRQGWTLSHGEVRRWSDYISNKYNEGGERKKPQPILSHAEHFCLCLCSTWSCQTELLPAVTMERFLFHLGESGGTAGIRRSEQVPLRSASSL